MAAETLFEVSSDEDERARLLTECKILLDYQSGLAAAEQDGKREGEKIGEERGVKIGEERGVKIGEERGVKIGEIGSAVNIIASLNISVAEAMSILKLAPEYHADLIAELKKQNISFNEQA